MRKKSLLGLLLLVVTTISHAAEQLDKIIATVNDDVITANELQLKTLTIKNQFLQQKKDIPQTLRQMALKELIDTNLQLQLAKANNITVDNIDLNMALKNIARTNKLNLKQLREAVVAQGTPWANYREQIRKEIILSKVQRQLLGNKLTISSKDIDNYKLVELAKNKTYLIKNLIIATGKSPELEKELADNIYKKLQNGATFASFSEVEGITQGSLGMRHLQNIPDIFVKKIKSMKKGDIAEPIQTGNGLQIIKLEDVSHYKTKLSNKDITNILKQKKFQTEIKNILSKARGRAYIKIYDKTLR